MISPEALFRYHIVSLTRTRMLAGESQAEAVRAVAALAHAFALKARVETRRVSTRSIYRWLAAFRENGIDGLEFSEQRIESTQSSVLGPRLLDFFVREKTDDPRVSIPELIRKAREKGELEQDEACDRTTVYRKLKRLGVPVGRRKQPKGGDQRRFAYPHRMDMVLCDGKHFRAGATRARRVALFFLDDATRAALHVVVGSSETAELFLRGLFELVSIHGLFDCIYLDHGSGFRALDVAEVIAKLDALLVHGEKAYPEGRGKIERFNRTAKQDVLRGFDRRPDIDPTFGALELRLRHYLKNLYNPRPHESLRGDSPLKRFTSDEKPLRFPEDREALKRKFEVSLERTVSSDNVVSVDSIDYEMPRGYDGAKVELRQRLLDPGGIFFLHEGRLLELHAVDLEANARRRRARGGQTHDDQDVQHPLPPSAADLAFQRDYGPVVDPDGGLPDLPQFSDASQEEEP